MASLNKVLLIGNLGADPELRSTANGTAVCNFRIATQRSWKDASGQLQKEVTWHSIVVWGRQAESCAQYLSIGRSVHIDGYIQHREWQDKDGNTRHTTEIVATSVIFLAGHRYDDRHDDRHDDRQGTRSSPHMDDSDIPF